MHELDDIDDNKRNALQYRFSGYQLPKIVLDETGHAYVVLPPHPYYFNQPMYWQKAAYVGNDLPTTGIVAPSVVPIENGRGGDSGGGRDDSNDTTYAEGLTPLLPLD